ncbi:hypothetical protein ACRRTK_015061 [Alexandromys fortis]
MSLSSSQQELSVPGCSKPRLSHGTIFSTLAGEKSSSDYKKLRGNKFQEDDLCSPCFRQSCGVIYVISYVESVVVSTPPPHCTDTCYQETWGLVAALSNCQNDCKGGSNDNDYPRMASITAYHEAVPTEAPVCSRLVSYALRGAE